MGSPFSVAQMSGLCGEATNTEVSSFGVDEFQMASRAMGTLGSKCWTKMSNSSPVRAIVTTSSCVWSEPSTSVVGGGYHFQLRSWTWKHISRSAFVRRSTVAFTHRLLSDIALID